MAAREPSNYKLFNDKYSNLYQPNPQGTIPIFTLGSVGEISCCAYNNSHVTIYGDDAMHLYNCKKVFKGECFTSGTPGKILLCMYRYNHHVHEDVMEIHLSLVCYEKWKDDKRKQEVPASMQSPWYDPDYFERDDSPREKQEEDDDSDCSTEVQPGDVIVGGEYDTDEKSDEDTTEEEDDEYVAEGPETEWNSWVFRSHGF